MKFSLALAATLFLPALINAQYGDPTPTSTDSAATGTSSSAAASSTAAPPSNSTNINVQVAAGGLVYSPSNFTASNGTTVTFFFPSGSIPHSVTEGSFANPCVYLAAAGGNPAGFDSGLQAGKEFSIQITNDQEPVWFFCKNSDHCGLGMVGAINAPTTGNTYGAFLAAAKALGANETPLSDTGPVTGGVGAVATATPGATTAGSSSTTKSSSATGSSSSASHLVANGLFALLATAFGITLA
jgi:plastocyanin